MRDLLIGFLPGAKTRYNLRVVETLTAARVLARVLSLDTLFSPSYPTKKFTLREVLSAYAVANESKPLETKGQAEPSLSPQETKVALEKLLGEVERLRPANLARWQSGASGAEEIGEEREGEELGLTYDDMVRYSGLGDAEFREVYLSWVDGAYRYFSVCGV